MGSFHQSKRSDNKWYTVEVRWGIFFENLTYFFLFLRAVANMPIQTLIIPPWLLLRKMIISQLELGPPVESVEVSCPWREACARKSGRGYCPCKAANKNCNANCQCCWRSCNEVTKLKIIKRLAVRYFSMFLFEIQNIFIRKCSTFIYNPQALPDSIQFRTWCFPLTLYTEYEAI